MIYRLARLEGLDAMNATCGIRTQLQHQQLEQFRSVRTELQIHAAANTIPDRRYKIS